MLCADTLRADAGGRVGELDDEEVGAARVPTPRGVHLAGVRACVCRACLSDLGTQTCKYEILV